MRGRRALLHALPALAAAIAAAPLAAQAYVERIDFPSVEPPVRRVNALLGALQVHDDAAFAALVSPAATLRRPFEADSVPLTLPALRSLLARCTLMSSHTIVSETRLEIWLGCTLDGRGMARRIAYSAAFEFEGTRISQIQIFPILVRR